MSDEQLRDVSEPGDGGDEPQSKDVKDVLDAMMKLRSQPRKTENSGQRPSKLRIQSGNAAVELEWWTEAEKAAQTAGKEPSDTPRVRVSDDAPAPGGRALQAVPDPVPDENANHVLAPMVGTFYHAPGPGEEPFVRVGDVVEPGQQIGILEAMKLMNPIEAEEPGRVTAILAPDATPVEYDQPLIALGPVDEA
ncbi:MAG: acetyl-CoA carboxylase biotin carboxyl carrier protein [Micromonosporaceae bacterium]